ncbi:response regulator [Neorhizobium petrolearium]|uniref:response regulator n=1 Tax=Neorhizobium petrolearium TaxID=515361 RepID=UPI003F5CD345
MMNYATAETVFLSHNGEMAHLIAAFDWAATTLGPIGDWPQSLKTVVNLILQSPVPIVTLWNDDGVMIYNDAYSSFAGGRHPDLLGSKVREGWPEVADFNDNVMKVGLAGGTLAYKDQELTLHRSGVPEQVWMNLDYSPIYNESGRPFGVMAVVVETTAKVRAERRLLGEQERLKQMFEQTPGFMAMVSGPGHVFEMANAAYMRLVGKRELLGRPIREALPEVVDQEFPDLLDEVRKSGLSHVGKARSVTLARHSGRPPEERFVDFVFQPILDDNRRTTGIFIQGNDVTDQKRAETALRKETRHLEVLNRLGADLSAELDLEKVVQMTTDAGVELTGAQFGAFFYNVHDERGESYMLYSLSGRPRSAFENFPMPRNTAVFAPTFKGEGVIRSDDILSDPRYGRNAPYHGMPKGHLPVRSYLAVPVVSRSGEVIGGLFFGHAQPGQFREEHERLVVGAAGQVAIAIDNARLFREAEREIAERRRAEEALQVLNTDLEQRVVTEIAERMKAEEALRHSQKMEALGQLTGGVAHDFNNLLQVISGNLQLLAGDVGEDQRVRRRIENALAGVQRGSKLASQLLAFSRRQPLEPKVINIGRFLTGMEELLRRTLGEDIEIETIRSGGLWNVLVDPTQIENALLNLAINARDAMEGGGKLTIEAGNAFLDDNYVRRHAEVPAGQYVMLAVTDTGTGMTPEVMEQVFEPFFSTKPVGKGTGLGLSMVYGFVRQSGGHIKIYSELGQGTTVKIYFPRIQRSEDLVTEADFGPVTGGTETILVAEDDEQVRATVVEMLGELGYGVLKAKDAAGALSVIESGVPIDMLFTDVVMPGPLKSTELARHARERLPDVAVLFTSGYTENSIVHGGRLDPGVDLLSKPYTREALARKIRHVLNNQQHRNRVRATLAAKSMPAMDERPAMPHYSVLLVEDDFLIRMSTADLLTELGHQISEASTAEEALALLQERHFDVVVTDLGLPGISGGQFAQEARKLSPDVGVVFATGNDRIPDEAAVEGAVLLQKPYGSEEIAAAFEKIAAQKA